MTTPQSRVAFHVGEIVQMPTVERQIEFLQAGRLAHAGASQGQLEGGIEDRGVLAVDQQGQADSFCAPIRT